MSDRLRQAFRDQADACEKLGSAFMGRLCRLLADRLVPGDPVSDRLLRWPGEVHPGAQSVPLRTAGALHGLVLDRADPALVAAYPPHDVPDDALWAAIAAAFRTHETRVMHWLGSAPQTNEVRRAAAMIPVAATLSARYRLPLVVSELGASAGLNLGFDKFRLELPGGALGPADSDVVLSPDWDGPLPPLVPFRVAEARGVDLNPIDTTDPAAALRLLAYLWPDQPDRIARTRAAIALRPPTPDAGDAAAWLSARLARPRPGQCHLIYHTIAWQYFPATTQETCANALAEAGSRAAQDAPIAHMSMEADGTAGSAALTLKIWDGTVPEGERHPLGRIDYHGRFAKITRAEWP